MDTTDEWIRERTGIRRTAGRRQHHRPGRRGGRGRARPGRHTRRVAMVLLATSTPDEAIPGSSATVAGAARARLRDHRPQRRVRRLRVRPRRRRRVPRARRRVGARRSASTSCRRSPTPTTAAPPSSSPTARAPSCSRRRTRQRRRPDRLGRRHRRLRPTTSSCAARAAPSRWRARPCSRWPSVPRPPRRSPRSTTAGIDPADVDLFIPHQANQRITDALASRLGLGPERVVSTIADTGNSSAGTIPYALSVAHDEGRLHDGAIVLMSGFGAGHDLGDAPSSAGRRPVMDRHHVTSSSWARSERAMADVDASPAGPWDGSPSSPVPTAASAWPSPASSPPPATGSPAPTAASTPTTTDILWVRCDVGDPDIGRRRVRRGRGRLRSRRSPRLQRRHHPRRPRPPHVRRRLHLGRRRQPLRRLPGGQALLKA